MGLESTTLLSRQSAHAVAYCATESSGLRFGYLAGEALHSQLPCTRQGPRRHERTSRRI